MAFDLTPVKPLGKIWTLDLVVSTIAQWLKKETQQELDPEFVKTLVNVAVLDVAEFLSGAGSDDYGKFAEITDQASSASETLVTGASYVNSTRRITKTPHGLLTNADVGKRIFYFDETISSDPRWFVIAEIESIVDDNTFVVSKAAGGNIASVNYVIFSAHATTNIDLSIYRLVNITKIVDSNTKEVVKCGDREFDNLHRFPERQNKIYWYSHGQYLFLYKGTDVANFGTLMMYFNSYPQTFTDGSSFLDVRDNYSSLVIATAKNYCLEHLEMAAPESLTSLIDNKKKEIRENIQREKGVIEQKNTTTKRG